jgi:MATE family multidrug resistance protein
MTAPCAPERQTLGAWHARVWALAGPIILSNLSTPLLGAVDTAVVGHLPDAAYIGGVAVGAVIFNFLYWGFGFLRMGTTGFTAQAFGAEDTAELRAALARPLLLAFVLGALLVFLQAPVGWLAFALFEASDQVEDFARSYYAIRIWSAPAALANYAMLGWLLGTRRAGAVLLIQLVLNGINILLDLLFVIGLGWGVEGVALASLLAELGAMVLGLAVVARALNTGGGSWEWARIASRQRLAILLQANLDIFIRTLCLLGAFAYFTARSATMGDVPLAGNAILLQLQSFTAYGLDGFAHAVEVLAGNALGARSRPAFREAVRVSTLWALGTAGAVTGIYLVLGASIVALFTDLEAVRRAAEAYLPWVVVAPLVSVWSFQLDGIFIGATRTSEMRNAMMLSLAIYLGACWVLVPTLGNHGLWLAFTIFMIARAATLGWLYPGLERSVGADGAGGPKR